MIRLERVISALPSGFDELRAEALAEGHHMLETLASEWNAGTRRFDRAGEMLLSAYVGGALAGIGGLTLEPMISGALRMRRFYVLEKYRRCGVGRALAITLLEEAKDRVVTPNAAIGSELFWQSLGFTPDRRDGYTHIRTVGQRAEGLVVQHEIDVDT